MELVWLTKSYDKPWLELFSKIEKGEVRGVIAKVDYSQLLDIKNQFEKKMCNKIFVLWEPSVPLFKTSGNKNLLFCVLWNYYLRTMKIRISYLRWCRYSRFFLSGLDWEFSRKKYCHCNIYSLFFFQLVTFY